MRLTKEDKDVLIYGSMIVITAVIFVLTLSIKQRGTSLMESPRLLPYFVEAFMFALSVGGLCSSLRHKGRPTLAKIRGSFQAAASDQQVRQTWLSIAVVGAYILIGIRFLGFYISSFLLIMIITLTCVKKIKPVWAILISVVITAILYIIFAVAFGMRLR